MESLGLHLLLRPVLFGRHSFNSSNGSVKMVLLMMIPPCTYLHKLDVYSFVPFIMGNNNIINV